MSHEAQSQSDIPVRTAEVLSAVIAGFAAEQVAQGAFTEITRPLPKGSLPVPVEHWAALALFTLGVIFTLLRYLHENSIYLGRQYIRWHHLEIEAGARLSTPVRHSIDVIAQMLQYLGVSATGYFLIASSLRLAVVILTMTAGARLLWAGVVYASHLHAPSSRVVRTAARNWAVLEAILIGATIIILLVPIGEDWQVLLSAGALWIIFGFDYIVNYGYLFDPGAQLGTIPVSQAQFALQYLSAASEVSRTMSPASADLEAIRTTARSALQKVFAFFMEVPNIREELFRRGPKALMHVGLYFEHDGRLYPFFRYHDDGIVPKNRVFPAGLHYVGFVFSQLRNKPTEAVIFARRETERVPGSAMPDDDQTARYYKSSIVAGLFMPPGVAPADKNALGILIVTSSEEDFFTPHLHQAMAVALARFVGDILANLLNPRSRGDIIDGLMRLVKAKDEAVETPIVVKTEAENE